MINSINWEAIGAVAELVSGAWWDSQGRNMLDPEFVAFVDQQLES